MTWRRLDDCLIKALEKTAQNLGEKNGKNKDNKTGVLDGRKIN